MQPYSFHITSTVRSGALLECVDDSLYQPESSVSQLLQRGNLAKGTSSTKNHYHHHRSPVNIAMQKPLNCLHAINKARLQPTHAGTCYDYRELVVEKLTQIVLTCSQPPALPSSTKPRDLPPTVPHDNRKFVAQHLCTGAKELASTCFKVSAEVTQPDSEEARRASNGSSSSVEHPSTGAFSSKQSSTSFVSSLPSSTSSSSFLEFRLQSLLSSTQKNKDNNSNNVVVSGLRCTLPPEGVPIKTGSLGTLDSPPWRPGVSLGAKCPHVNQWKRLRAKKGLVYYSCKQCGMHWRIPSGRYFGGICRKQLFPVPENGTCNEIANSTTAGSPAKEQECHIDHSEEGEYGVSVEDDEDKPSGIIAMSRTAVKHRSCSSTPLADTPSHSAPSTPALYSFLMAPFSVAELMATPSLTATASTHEVGSQELAVTLAVSQLLDSFSQLEQPCPAETQWA